MTFFKKVIILMKKIKLLGALFGVLFLISCAARTTLNPNKPEMAPRTITGDFFSIFKIAKNAAYQTFADGQLNANPNDGVITIIRRNLWRGDTIIRITVSDNGDGTFTIYVSSKGYGSNPPMVDWSTGEVKKYLKEFDILSKSYKKNYKEKNTNNEQSSNSSENVSSNNNSLKSIYDDYFNSVVIIRTQRGIGSGFFISENGYIVTNNHVIEGNTNVSVKLKSGRLLLGNIVNTSPERDLALVKVEGNNFPWLDLSKNNQLEIGSDVIAIGTPQGLSWSISKGIISQVRQLSNVTVIQTDTPINPGNSGGPLISLKNGRVVGINTFGFKKNISEGLNFAISAEEILIAFPNISK
jgi:S1-C subfamily serine protease